MVAGVVAPHNGDGGFAYRQLELHSQNFPFRQTFGIQLVKSLPEKYNGWQKSLPENDIRLLYAYYKDVSAPKSSSFGGGAGATNIKGRKTAVV